MTNPNFPEAPELKSIDFGQIATVTALLTPRIAEQYLDASAGLKPKNFKAIRRLVADADAGWLYTGDSLKFSPDGKMIDGASRCAAVLVTGASMVVDVKTGIDAEARNVIDTGAAMKLKFALDNLGVKRAGDVAASLYGVIAWERGDFHTEQGPYAPETSIPAALKFLDENPDMESVAIDARRLSVKVPGLGVRNLAILVRAFDEIDRSDRTDFFSQLSTASTEQSRNPIVILRKRLLEHVTGEQKFSDKKLIGMSVKAWNAYRENRDVNDVIVFAGGLKPEAFPKPI